LSPTNFSTRAVPSPGVVLILARNP
jgi:hypothetical protein